MGDFPWIPGGLSYFREVWARENAHVSHTKGQHCRERLALNTLEEAWSGGFS
jgi:hypothetical protein